jgi:cytochrome b
MVIAFLTNYLTEGETNLHFYSGWYILLLLSLRVIWGFFGTKYARFIDFVKPPSEVLKYVRMLVFKHQGFNKKHICISGVMAYTSEGKRFYDFIEQPLLQDIDEHEQHLIEKVAGNVNEESDEEFWEEIHEFLSNFTLFLILLHIAGVILSSRLQRQNLIKSMIYGRKKIDKK